MGKITHDQAWELIQKAYKKTKENVVNKGMVPQKTGVISAVFIKDIDLTYTEEMGFGRYELYKGKSEKTEIFLTMDFKTYHLLQSGQVKPMKCLLTKKMKVEGIPLKFMRAGKITDEFRSVYKEVSDASDIQIEAD